jgi:hypothetical protein
MQRSPRPRKKPANLSESVHRRLNSYALAASAAGVGALALAQPAEAKIVYTPAHVKIVHGGVNLDLNHDGIADFTINSNSGIRDFFINVFSLHQNRIWGGIGSASALPAGVRVGSNQAKFQKGRSCGSSYAGPCKLMQLCSASSASTFCIGPWANATRGYLGLKFHIKGEIHFGWARFNRKTTKLGQWVLTGYAYETVPRKPIITGKTTGKTKGADNNIVGQPDAALLAPPSPATLGALAKGAPRLSIWRREEPAGSVQ